MSTTYTGTPSSNVMGDDLDLLFGSTNNAAPSIPAASNSDLGFDFGATPPMPPPTQPSSSSVGDLLGMSSSSGTGGVRPAAPTSGSVHSDLDLFGQPQSSSGRHGGSSAAAADDEYADIFTRIRTKVLAACGALVVHAVFDTSCRRTSCAHACVLLCAHTPSSTHIHTYIHRRVHL